MTVLYSEICEHLSDGFSLASQVAMLAPWGLQVVLPASRMQIDTTSGEVLLVRVSTCDFLRDIHSHVHGTARPTQDWR